MSVAIVIPWRAGAADREVNLEWTLARYRERFPHDPVVFGSCAADLPFNRSAAILDGARQTSADVLIVADADCWSDGVGDAVEMVAHGAPWAVPHLKLHRLTPESSARVLAGELPDESMPCLEVYKGFEAGTLLVIQRDVLFDVPPDVRFASWGQEDQCWAFALRALIGAPWRGRAPCFHLWHEPQQRMSRMFGSEENKALYRRYRAARHKPAVMRSLIDEATSDVPPALGAHPR